MDTRLVAIWLAGKPDSWVIRVGPLCGRMGIGRDRWRRIAGELERHGYLLRERRQNPDGTWRWQFAFSAAGDLAAADGGAPPPPRTVDEARRPSCTPRKSRTAATGRALTTEEVRAIDLEIEAANRAAARGERRPIGHPAKYRAQLSGQMLAGTFQPSAAALSLATARKAEVQRLARLAAQPGELTRKTMPPSDAIANCRAALGLHPTSDLTKAKKNARQAGPTSL
ncbi:MAG: hypothetical protein ACYCWA_02490 [Thiobacillus sp.]